jgi:hypothetical protein
MTNNKLIFSLLLTLLSLSFVSAISIDFVNPTPANGSTVNTRNVTINATINIGNSYNVHHTNGTLGTSYMLPTSNTSIGAQWLGGGGIINGTNYTLSNITLWGGKYGTPNNITINIYKYNFTTDTLIGSSLTSAVYNGNLLPEIIDSNNESEGVQFTFNFANTILIENGTYYAFLVTAQNNTDSGFYMYGGSDYGTDEYDTYYIETYPNNTMKLADSSIDMNFKIYGVTRNPLSSIIWNWNGTNYSIYDPSLLFYYNFDNRSALGENSSWVADLTGKYNITSIDSNASVCADGHNGGGACFTGKSGSNIEMDMTPTGFTVPFNGLNNKTISAWVKTNVSESTARTIMRFSYSSGVSQWFLIQSSYNQLSFADSTNSSAYKSRTCSTDFAVDNDWTHVAVTFEFNKSFAMYVNGKPCLFSSGGDYNAGNTNWNTYYSKINETTTLTDIDIGEGYSFSGTMDDVALWNRSLSAEEIKRIYDSSLTKLSNTDYNLLIVKDNERVNSIVNTNICINDSLSNNNCTATRTLNLGWSPILTSLFSNIIGNVYSNFYGAGLQSPKLVSGSIDTNCDGTSETLRNYTWQQNTWNNALLKASYMDAGLNNYYRGIENPSFEYWVNDTTKNVTSSEERAFGWVNSGGGGNIIYRSTDAHTGNYSMGINGSSGTSGYMISYFTNSEDLKLKNNSNYTVYIWAKGFGTFRMGLQESGGSYNPCSTYTTFTVNDTWQQFNYTCNTNTVSAYDYRWSFDGINTTEYVLFDDFSMTQNGSAYDFWYMGGLENIIAQVEWEKANNVQTMLILDYMPEFLSRRDSTCVTSGTDTDFSDCPAYNNTIFTDMAIDYYKRVDNYTNTSWVEVWNEPYGGFWQDQLTYNSAKTDFMIFYNNTYDAFKAYNSDIKMMGYRDTSLDSFGGTLTNFTIMMLSNLPTKFDGFSFHPYYSVGYINGENKIDNAIEELYATFDTYGVTTRHLLLDEWQPNYATRNESNAKAPRYYAEISYFYDLILNSYPQNVSSYYFHWDDSVSYFNCPSRYSEYPSFWSGISEAGLDNAEPTYYPTYLVTSNFSRYAPAGGTVYNSTSDYNLIKVVSTKIGTTDNIIITNADTDSVNITLNTDNLNTDLLIDVESGVLYDVSSGTTNLGVMDAYEIKYLSTPYTDIISNEYWFVNYLEEPIRLMTEDEIYNYTTQFLIINYNYNYNTQEQNNIPGVNDSILNNILGMISNFFSMAPVIGSISAIILVVGALVILIMYLSKVRNPDISPNSKEFIG